jgi:hypothetical protein
VARRHNADKPVEKNSSGIPKLTKKKPTVSMSVGRIRRVGTLTCRPDCHPGAIAAKYWAARFARHRAAVRARRDELCHIQCTNERCGR